MRKLSVVVLVVFLPLFLFSFNLIHKEKEELLNSDGEDIRISISELSPFLYDGSCIVMEDVFRFNWDVMTVVNAPTPLQDTDGRWTTPYDQIIDYYHGNYTFRNDVKFVIMFHYENKLVGFIDYPALSKEMPQFCENDNHNFNWILEVNREKAVFSCSVAYDGSTLVYHLELIDNESEGL